MKQTIMITMVLVICAMQYASAMEQENYELAKSIIIDGSLTQFQEYLTGLDTYKDHTELHKLYAFAEQRSEVIIENEKAKMTEILKLIDAKIPWRLRYDKDRDCHYFLPKE